MAHSIGSFPTLTMTVYFQALLCNILVKGALVYKASWHTILYILYNFQWSAMRFYMTCLSRFDEIG